METYLKIEADINAVKDWNQEAGNKLYNQMCRAQSASWTIAELSELLKTEEDVADEYYNINDPRHAEIRQIQDSIINFYGDDEE